MSYKISNKLPLLLDDSFKLLNSFCFSSKNPTVLMIRQGNQILGSIIISNTIEMMNNPIMRQRFAIFYPPFPL